MCTTSEKLLDIGRGVKSETIKDVKNITKEKIFKKILVLWRATRGATQTFADLEKMTEMIK
jgi:hypothetical protein